MILASSEGGPRVLVVGEDGEIGAMLHLHLLRAGWSPVCVPSPELVEPIVPFVAPHAIVLILPESPATSWASALTASATAAQAGVRVVLIAPSREVVEPLAIVAGAERALSRTEALVAPRSVLGPPPPRGLPAPSIARRRGTTGAIPIPAVPAPASTPSERKKTSSGGLPLGRPTPPPAGGTEGPPVGFDLAELLQEELADAPEVTPLRTHLSADVSLVSEHNFFVGATRRLDSGGVFVSMPQPLPVGTAVEVRLGLPDTRKVDVRGTVVFVRARGATAGRQPPGCGIMLSSVPSWAVGVAERFFVDRPPILHQP